MENYNQTMEYNDLVEAINKLYIGILNTPISREELDVDAQNEERERQREEEMKADWWGRKEREDRKYCADNNVVILYKGRNIATYEELPGNTRLLISIRNRSDFACAVCRTMNTALRRKLCKKCDFLIPLDQNVEY